MRSPVSLDLLPDLDTADLDIADLDITDLDIADLTFGSKNWDRRRSGESKQASVTFLEDAANHLIADQIGPDRIYWPGAVDAVQILRGAIAEIWSERRLEERAARVAASWLPKYTLARNALLRDSDA